MALQEMKYSWVFKEKETKKASWADKRELFRQYTANLQLMVDWYVKDRQKTR